MSLISKQAKSYTRDNPVRKEAVENISARDLQVGHVMRGPGMGGAGTPISGVGGGTVTQVSEEWGTVGVWLDGSEKDNAFADWIFNHGDPVAVETATVAKKKQASNGWDRDTDLDGLEDSWKDYGDGIYGQVVFRDGLGFVGWVEDQNSGVEYAHEIGGSIDEVERALDQTVESQGIIAKVAIDGDGYPPNSRAVPLEEYTNAELGALYADVSRWVRDGYADPEDKTLLAEVEDELERRGHPRSASRKTAFSEGDRVKVDWGGDFMNKYESDTGVVIDPDYTSAQGDDGGNVSGLILVRMDESSHGGQSEVAFPKNKVTKASSGRNPVGQKVTVKSGPDAGLTGLVSRVASSGFFVEIEGAEAGPYRQSNLVPERTPKTSKKTANFAGQYVWVEVDGEWIQGFVHEDDGGPTVEVSDPEDDPYMVGAPAEVPREQVFREIPNTAKKASHDPFDDGYKGAPDIRVGDRVETHLGDGTVIENPYGGEKLWVEVESGGQIPIDSPGVALISGGVVGKQAANYKGTICRICEVGKLKVTEVPYGYTCDYCWSTFDWEGNYTGRVGS